MLRSVIACGFATFLALAGAGPLPAQTGNEPPPNTYELMINGESFLVEANQQTKLKSREKPGVEYDVALRVAPRQRLTLNTFQLEYELPARVDDDHGRTQRSVRIHHELGFTILLTDLGEPIPDENRDKALEVLRDSVAASLKESGMKILNVAKPHTRDFTHSKGYGVVLRLQDAGGNPQTCMVYLLRGDKMAVSCVVQHLDADADQVLDRIKRVLDSVQPLR